MVGRLRGKPAFVNSQDYEMDQGHQQTNMLLNKGQRQDVNITTNGSSNNNTSSGLDHLIEEYNEFHLRWIERVKHIASLPSNHSANN